MKKSLLVVLLLLLCTGVGIWAAAAYIYRPHDQVTFTEETVSGDPSAAEGLTVRAQSQYNHRLFWDSVCRVGEEPQTETEYAFYPDQHQTDRPARYAGVEMENGGYGSTAFAASGGFETEEMGAYGLNAAYRELADQTAPGAEGEKVIRVSDYLDYYPLEVRLDFPEFLLDLNRMMDWGTDGGEETKAVSLLQTFQNFFRIPVLEEERMEISIGKDPSGGINSWGSGSVSEYDSFYLWTESVVTGSACYFTFDCHTEQDHVVDTSQIPGGYGIYRLTCQYDPERMGSELERVDIEELSMVYPLDPNGYLLELGLSGDGERLLVHTREEDTYVLTVVDLEDLSTVQRLEITPDEKDWSWCYVFPEEDYLAVTMGEQVALLVQQEGGVYQEAFLTDVEEDVIWQNFQDMDYDGRHLAVTGVYDFDEARLDYNLRDGHSFYLAVYGPEGLEYYGLYRSSLDVTGKEEDYRDYCHPVSYHPLCVSWP